MYNYVAQFISQFISLIFNLQKVIHCQSLNKDNDFTEKIDYYIIQTICNCFSVSYI